MSDRLSGPEKEPLARVLGKRIRSIRIARGLSREALAERAGLSSRDLLYYERGRKRMRPDPLLRIVAALEVRLSAIFGDERPVAGRSRTTCRHGFRP